MYDQGRSQDLGGGWCSWVRVWVGTHEARIWVAGGAHGSEFGSVHMKPGFGWRVVLMGQSLGRYTSLVFTTLLTGVKASSVNTAY